MIDRFEIIDHDSPRPKAERILFCDGTEERLFRAETDMELNPPNTGPERPPKSAAGSWTIPDPAHGRLR